MPYNTTPIPPPKEFTGTVSLPLARIKKIIEADDETNKCSLNAAFAIAIATEQFIQYLTEHAQIASKADKRIARRNIQYKDVATAVASRENLEFLSDVVPKTITYGQWKARENRVKRAKATVERVKNFQKGQRTMEQMTKKKDDDDDMDMEEADEDEGVALNGHDEVGSDDEGVTSGSKPNSAAAAAGARHDFHAVTGGYDAGPEDHVPMEE